MPDDILLAFILFIADPFPESEPEKDPEKTNLVSSDDTLVLNDADDLVDEPDIPVAVKLLINVALGPREPDIPLEVNPTAPPSSRNVTLVENEELGATNEPDIADFNANVDKF